MFRPFNLRDFIKKPADKCASDECENGANKIADVLKSNPQILLEIILMDQAQPASWLFVELCKKLDKVDKKDVLIPLLENKYIATLCDNCIENKKNLESIVQAMPNFQEKIYAYIRSNQELKDNIFAANENIESFFEQLAQKFPQENFSPENAKPI